MSSEVETSLEIAGSRRIPRFLDSAQNDKTQQATRPLFADLTIYQDENPHSAAMNMAIDEALLEMAVVPTIRFYRWRSPALSFGYFGKFSDVAIYAAERDLVRRWTGGGIVFHGEDLTYSIVIPASDPVFDESSIAIYEKIHRALCGALAGDGQDAELASVAELCERRKSRKGDLQIAQRRTGDRRSLKFAAVRNLSDRGDLREAAANLFRCLRELDALGLDLIIAERVPSRGLGAAIMDRLERASHR
jgi:hypothetical protein